MADSGRRAIWRRRGRRRGRRGRRLRLPQGSGDVDAGGRDPVAGISNGSACALQEALDRIRIARGVVLEEESSRTSDVGRGLRGAKVRRDAAPSTGRGDERTGGQQIERRSAVREAGHLVGRSLCVSADVGKGDRTERTVVDRSDSDHARNAGRGSHQSRGSAVPRARDDGYTARPKRRDCRGESECVSRCPVARSREELVGPKLMLMTRTSG